jgi:dienelactone hydrolase
VDEFAAKYRALLPTYFTDPRHKANLGALLIRLDHLLDLSYRENDNHLWQKKIAQLCWQIETITADIRTGREPYRGKTGTWLRGFISPIDGNLQYYLVHAPPQGDGNRRPFPLVIELPYEEVPLRPYLFSIPVAQYSDIKLHDRVADANGFGYLWLNNRGNTYGQDFGLADLFSALAEVERDYPIDTDRIYLFGDCTGALHSLALAADHPDLFAAVGAAIPISRYRRVTLFDPPSPTDRYACNWLQARSPVERTENLLDVPVLMMHGDEDTHTPISEAEALDNAARASGAPFQFSVAHGGTALRWPVDRLYPMFAFFRDKSRVQGPAHFAYTANSPTKRQAYWLRIDGFVDPLLPARIEGSITEGGQITVLTKNVQSYSILLDKLGRTPQSITVTTNGVKSYSGHAGEVALPISVVSGSPDLKSSNLPGPMSEAFTGPFLLVIGTQGQEAGAAAAQAMAFQESWHSRFFTTARSKLDTEVSDDDIRNYSLILFGTAQSNKILTRIGQSLPVQYEADGVTLGSQKFPGQGYSVQAVFPNPLEPSRYVVLAGDPACTKCPANALQFTLHAWYDAAVWQRNEGGLIRLVSVGRFDGSWKKFVPEQPCR